MSDWRLSAMISQKIFLHTFYIITQIVYFGTRLDLKQTRK